MAEPISPSQTSSTPGSPMKTINPLLNHEPQLKLERRAVRKLDLTILPMLGMFYCLANLDRINIGSARLAGLQNDLHFTDKQFHIWISVLFVPYIASDLPSNLLLRKIGPGLLMPALLTFLGVLSILQGFVTSSAGLITVRVFMALVEGTILPTIVLYLSGFYTRKELSLRIALFFTPVTLSDLFSNFLAFLIGMMNGVGGKPGWAWIFILEGLLTVLTGVISFFVLPSTPYDSKILTENQKNLVMKRLERDRPSIHPVDTFSLKQVLRSVLSPHVIMVSLMFFMNGAMLYGLTPFVPSVIQQLGFRPIKSQLLSIAPLGTGWLVTVLSAFFSDRYNSRGITTALVALLTVVGYALYLGTEHNLTAFAALFFIVSGVYATAPLLAAWMANNSEPHYRRATSIALFTMMYNSGGILSWWSFPTNEGPKFKKITIIYLIFAILLAVGSFINMTYLSLMNKIKTCPEERARLLEKYVESDTEGNDGGLKAWMELGDRHPDFVYIL